MENEYINLIHSLPDIVYRIDSNGNFLYINDSINKLGYTQDELTGKHFDSIIAPSDRDRVNWELFLPHKGNRKVKNGTSQFINERRTGKRITKNLRVQLACKDSNADSPVTCRKGEVFATGLYKHNEKGSKYLGTLGIIRDFTSELSTDNKLFRLEKYYRLLIENSFEIIMVIVQDGTILFTSKSVERNLECKTIDLIGENIEEIIHPDNLLFLNHFIKSGIDQTGTSKRSEFRFRHNNGEWRFFETAITPILDHDKKNVMCYVFPASDITERISFEKAMWKRERIYKTLLRTSPDAIVLFDTVGDLILANDRAAGFAGLPREELIGRNFLSFIADDSKENAKLISKDVIQHGTINDYQISVCKSNGEIIPTEVSVSCIRDDHGTLEGYLTIFRDITLRKRAEGERKRLEEELLKIILNRLSEREVQLLQYLAGGYRWPEQKREIGKLMDALPGTLDQFATRIKKKMDMDDIDKIAVLANLHFKWG